MSENFSGEKILITGGTGFLGGYLVKELISKGCVPTVLTRNLRTHIGQVFGGKVNCVQVDLFEHRHLAKVLKQLRPDIIIHLAGYVHQAGISEDVSEKLNFEASCRLLELADAIEVKRFILTGTADEYGFQASPQSENLKAMPVSNYAISKNRAVNQALFLYEKTKLPVVILRPFTVYGVGQPSKMFITQAVNCAVRKIPFEMSEGLQKRDLLFVTDFTDAIIEFIKAEKVEGEIFNVGSGTSVALRDLALKIWHITGADEKLLQIGARQTNAGELHDTEADITKISRYLNWKPKITLDEGLRTVIESVKNNLQ